MKFNRLVSKFESFANKLEQGSGIIPEKLEKLQQLLEAKKTRYESKLTATQDSVKRRKLETRLNVVAAQLEKLKQL